MFYITKGKSIEKSDACSTSEDIIELQDVRMSPIASLRNRHYSNTVGTTDADNTIDLAQFPPSFRISRSYVTNNRLRHRGNKGI